MNRNERFVCGEAFRLVLPVWAMLRMVMVVVLSSICVVSGAQAQQSIELRVASATVPAGGTLEFQLAPTTPKPIVKGRQGASFTTGVFAAPVPAASILGALQGGSLFSPGGDASGFALPSGNSVQVSFNSTQSLLGTSLDTPPLVLLFPVKATATAGQTENLTLDPKIADWVDPTTGQNYAVTLTSGVMTVGGTLSIASISPGSGTVSAGKKIVIRGTGFVAGLTVKLSVDAKASTITVVSTSEVDITLDTTVNLTGAAITLTNPNREAATFYSFQKYASQSASKHALLKLALPMFSTLTYTSAFFHPVLSGSTFSGIALQNTGTANASIQLQLSSSSGVLGTTSITVSAGRYVVRDVSELFPGVIVPPANSTLQATTAATGIQMLGFTGDDSAKTITPVDPLLTP